MRARRSLTGSATIDTVLLAPRGLVVRHCGAHLAGVGAGTHRLCQVGGPGITAAAEITLGRWDAQARRRSAWRRSAPVDGSIDDEHARQIRTGWRGTRAHPG